MKIQLYLINNMKYFHILFKIYMKHTKIIFINETPLKSEKLAVELEHIDFCIDDGCEQD